MSKYQRGKIKARNKAIDWQNSFYNYKYSYDELVYYGNFFERLARKYGLVREFRENGII